MPFGERESSPAIVLRLDEVTQALAGLAEVLNEEADLGPVLRSVAEQAARAVPGADMASISVVRGGSKQAQTAAGSNDRVWGIDAQQYAAGDGPCLDAARTGRIVRMDAAQAHERWPRFASGAGQAGVASYLSAPLSIDDQYAGSLNLYGERPGSFDDLDEVLLRLYTTTATEAIANARRYARARTEAESLRRGWSRT